LPSRLHAHAYDRSHAHSARARRWRALALSRSPNRGNHRVRNTSVTAKLTSALSSDDLQVFALTLIAAAALAAPQPRLGSPNGIECDACKDVSGSSGAFPPPARMLSINLLPACTNCFAHADAAAAAAVIMPQRQPSAHRRTSPCTPDSLHRTVQYTYVVQSSDICGVCATFQPVWQTHPIRTSHPTHTSLHFVLTYCIARCAAMYSIDRV